MGAEEACPAPAIAVAGRAEIDTSAPFESVREAVDRFGGSAAWSSRFIKRMFAPPNPKDHELSEETEQAVSVEEQTAQLENELLIKERETLDVLKELESTKKIIADLKLKIRSQETETCPAAEKSDEGTESLLTESVEEQPENIIVEFELVKESLNRTTGDLAAIRATVESLRDSIGKERALLQSGREKLSSDAALISSLEDELDQTSQMLQTLKDLQARRERPSDIFTEIKKMASEVRQLRRMADASKSEAVILAVEIEQAKASIGTAEARCVAAKKMEEAARAAEAIALADIKALLSSENYSEGSSSSVSDGVTLSVEDYSMMYTRAQEADYNTNKKVEEAMLQVDAANTSESDSVRKLEDAKQDVEECKKALQEALERVEAANHGKLAVEDIVRRWRSQSGHKRRSIGGSPKFKNAGHRRKLSRSMDMVSDVSSSSSFKPTLSIGQILTMKLTGPDGYDKSVWDDKTGELPTVSLGQIINRKSAVVCTEETTASERISGKRKKFALTGLSGLLAKQSKSKKKRESL
ncbi:WEB family protein At2g38370 isoform X2 [Lolium perenne]|uniref:WEB family protein At2g38370 isoform X2 n=1 Tax=Lolium perenne TaxID=4522 RepID=UPI0021EAD1FB|nr:WEB family protein At2g38370-like isoform X2 [Lolium perenne]